MNKNRNYSNILIKLTKLIITLLLAISISITQFSTVFAEDIEDDLLSQDENYTDGELTIDPEHDNGIEEDEITIVLSDDPDPVVEARSQIMMYSALTYASFAPKILSINQVGGSDRSIIIYSASTGTVRIASLSNRASSNADVGLLDEANGRYKIIISGAVGWIDKESFMEPKDTNSQGVSHYSVNGNGDLIHNISKLVGSTSYSPILQGKAPSYLSQGTQYYSYDGHYFYVNRVTMLNDYKNSTRNNSLNSTQPFYNYFQYLPYRSLSNISGQQLDDYIKNVKGFTQSIPKDTNEGILSHQSNLFEAGTISVWQGNKYGANGLLTMSIAIHESGWGRSYLAANRKNLFGHEAYDATPGSAKAYEHIFDSFWSHNAKFLNWNFLDFDSYSFKGGYLGNKESGINNYYATDPYWGEKAASYYHTMDRYFGNADYDGYRLGVKKSAGTVDIRREPAVDSPAVTNIVEKYKAQLRESNQVVVILGEVKGEVVAGSDVWYKISIDSLVESSTRNLLYIGPTINGDREHRNAGYDFKNSYGYVHSSTLTQTDYKGSKTINPPVTNEPVVVRPTPPVTPPVTPPKPTYQKGDVNGDGSITAVDYMLIKNHIMDKSKLTGENLARADVNKDGSITAVDYMIIKNIIMGR